MICVSFGHMIQKRHLEIRVEVSVRQVELYRSGCECCVRSDLLLSVCLCAAFQPSEEQDVPEKE